MAPDITKMQEDIEIAKKDINKILTNEIVHIQKDIEILKKDILKLYPRTTSFYFGILFIVFIVGISLLCLPLDYAIGIIIVCILPLLMCVYAIYRLRRRKI